METRDERQGGVCVVLAKRPTIYDCCPSFSKRATSQRRGQINLQLLKSHLLEVLTHQGVSGVVPLELVLLKVVGAVGVLPGRSLQDSELTIGDVGVSLLLFQLFKVNLKQLAYSSFYFGWGVGMGVRGGGYKKC